MLGKHVFTALFIVAGLVTANSTGDQSFFTPAHRKHWSLQPVKRPAVPAVKGGEWVQTPVDAFVLSKLESRGIAGSAAADG
jgi:hypothetical protein